MDPLSLITSKFTPWIVIAAMVGALALQSGRLDHAKGDLKTARAALVNPATKKTWQQDYTRTAADLTTCHANEGALAAAVDRQTAAARAAEADGRAQAAKAASGYQRGLREGLTRQAAADRILSIKPAGADLCARLIDAERQITETEQ